MGICDGSNIFVTISLLFAIKNLKTAKDILDKKVPTIGISVVAISKLQFFALYILDEKTGTYY